MALGSIDLAPLWSRSMSASASLGPPAGMQPSSHKNDLPFASLRQNGLSSSPFGVYRRKTFTIILEAKPGTVGCLPGLFVVPRLTMRLPIYWIAGGYLT